MNANTTLSISDDFDDAPVWTADDFKTAVHRVGLKPVLQNEQKIKIELDPDIAAWFKAKAREGEFQALINHVLREAMEGKKLEEMLRKIIREELQQI